MKNWCKEGDGAQTNLELLQSFAYGGQMRHGLVVWNYLTNANEVVEA